MIENNGPLVENRRHFSWLIDTEEQDNNYIFRWPKLTQSALSKVLRKEMAVAFRPSVFLRKQRPSLANGCAGRCYHPSDIPLALPVGLRGPPRVMTLASMFCRSHRVEFRGRLENAIDAFAWLRFTLLQPAFHLPAKEWIRPFAQRHEQCNCTYRIFTPPLPSHPS